MNNEEETEPITYSTTWAGDGEVYVKPARRESYVGSLPVTGQALLPLDIAKYTEGEVTAQEVAEILGDGGSITVEVTYP